MQEKPLPPDAERFTIILFVVVAILYGAWAWYNMGKVSYPEEGYPDREMEFIR